MLPPLDWEGRRAYGASDSQLARLTQRVPVILARWRLGREDPAELFGAVQERLKEAGTKPAG
jgi:hypothetical protein